MKIAGIKTTPLPVPFSRPCYSAWLLGSVPIAAMMSTTLALAQLAPVNTNHLRDAYYGDLHLHSSYSIDAYAVYGAQVDPDGAYRFARGELGTYMDEEITRSSPPLDFVAVTDHPELLGVLNTLENSHEAYASLSEWWPKAVPGVKPLPPLPEAFAAIDSDKVSRSAWKEVIDAANRNYQPGKFTTFIAYEWSSTPGMRNLHRNVIFSGDTAPHPLTSIDTEKPEDLWTYLERIRDMGYDAIAIPHNSNASSGSMFDRVDSSGRTMNGSYAVRRSINEPVVEIFQTKGQSETHSAISVGDEFADFEVFDFYQDAREGGVSEPRGSYIRDALGRGIEMAEHGGGINPFKFGVVGGTDFHNGLSESAENAYAGMQVSVRPDRLPNLEVWLERTLGAVLVPGLRKRLERQLYETGSGGLTGVWAEQNTRESIFAALRRKETFATSGTRLKVRFFGGWEYGSGLIEKRDWVRDAYRGGVAMGGDLPAQVPGRNAPVFAMWAAKDPNGANLDRLQIVKIWLRDKNYVEKVYDVALSDERKVDPDTGRAPVVGSTVNLQTAAYVNTIGAVELSIVWEDPQFDPKVPALYYLRVLEIPTPRWSTIAAIKRREPLPKGVPATIQERGLSSPIWYVPPVKW